MITCYDQVANYMSRYLHHLPFFILQQLVKKLRFVNFQSEQILSKGFTNCVVKIEQQTLRYFGWVKVKASLTLFRKQNNTRCAYTLRLIPLRHLCNQCSERFWSRLQPYVNVYPAQQHAL